MSSYKYTCDECDSYVRTNEPMKCPVCSMNLCEPCQKKNTFHVCNWCYNEIPPELMGRRKALIFLLIIMPIVLVFMPVPLPVIIMFFAESSGNLWQAFYLIGVIAISFVVYPLMLKRNKMKILDVLKNPSKKKAKKRKQAENKEHTSNSKENKNPVKEEIDETQTSIKKNS